MNRRGHIGTLLMVFGALILVITALFVMNSSGKKASGIRNELGSLSDKVIVAHEAVHTNVRKLISESIASSGNSLDFESAFNASIKELSEKERDSNQNTNLYAKLALGDYSLLFDGRNYVLVASNIFEQTDIAKNEGRYVYSLRVLFNKSGIVSVEYLETSELL